MKFFLIVLALFTASAHAQTQQDSVCIAALLTATRGPGAVYQQAILDKLKTRFPNDKIVQDISKEIELSKDPKLGKKTYVFHFEGPDLENFLENWTVLTDYTISDHLNRIYEYQSESLKSFNGFLYHIVKGDMLSVYKKHSNLARDPDRMREKPKKSEARELKIEALNSGDSPREKVKYIAGIIDLRFQLRDISDSEFKSFFGETPHRYYTLGLITKLIVSPGGKRELILGIDVTPVDRTR